MKGFVPLFKLSFKSMMLNSMNMGGARRKKRRGLINAQSMGAAGALLMLCAIMVFISATYSSTLAQVFAPLGGLDVVLLYMGLMATFFPLVFVIYGAQSTVYSTKDMDILLSFPVSPLAIMLSRLLALYLQAMLMCEMMLIPAGVAYLYYGGGGGALFMARLLLCGILLPFIPTTLSLLLGGVVSFVSSRTRFKNLVNVLFSILLVAAMLVLVFGYTGTMGATEGANFNLEGMRQTLGGIMPPVGWAVQAQLGSWAMMGLLAAVCLLPFLLLGWFFSLFYKRILTLLSSHYLRNDYKLRSLKATGSFSALFRKELRKFFGTPAYVLNAGIGILITVAASVAAVIFKGSITSFLGALAPSMGTDFITRYLPPLLLAAVQFMASMSFVSAVSVSLEGKTLWILKEAPLGVGKIFTAKTGVDFVLGAFTTLVCTPLLGWAFGISAAEVALMCLLGLLFAALTAMLGLFINLLMPRLDGENDTVIIKQSSSVMVSMLFSVIIIGLFVGLFLLMNRFIPGFVPFALASAVLLAGLDGLLVLLLNTVGRKRWAAL